VEVQTTISVVPIKKDQFRMIMNLRTLAMLDSGPSQVSITASKGGQATEAYATTESSLISPQVQCSCTYIQTQDKAQGGIF